MHYIVFDLEFNQDPSSIISPTENPSMLPFEIIQIGALKLDHFLKTVATFNQYIKPAIYSKINPVISELTGITSDQLDYGKPFSQVYYDFLDFIGSTDNIFCVWGMSDVKELFKNADYYQLDKQRIPRKFINIQPYVSIFLGLPVTKLLNLKVAVDALQILNTYSFHNALHDSFYTAEIFKKIYSPSILPKHYDPTFVHMKARSRQPRKIIDFDRLIQQFEKMYGRKLTPQEIEMIKLAYHMGKTNQFIRYD